MLSRWTSVLICVSLTGGAYGQEKVALAQVGERAPEIGLETLLQAPDKAVASLDALKGKVVVLEFWATWCGPCIAAIPHLNELADKFEGKPVQFISVTDEKEAVIKKFLDKKPMRGWVGLDTDRSTFKAYGIRGIPRTVLIGKKGEIAAITSPSALTEKILDEMVAGKALSLDILDGRRALPPGGKTQSDELPALFEVSIRPSANKTGMGGSSSSARGQATFRGYSVLSAVARAFEVRQTRIVDRASLPDGQFDIVVLVPEDRDDLLKPLFRQALETTFGIKARREKQEMAAYVLTVAKGGVKEGLQPTVSTGGSSYHGGQNSFTCVNQSIDSLGSNLESMLGRPVLDRTKLDGRFDFELEHETNDEKGIGAALRDQFGLELTRDKESVEVLIVEKASE